MRIAIIGATGGSGRHFLELASGAGHDVTALARSVEKLPGLDELPRFATLAVSRRTCATF